MDPNCKYKITDKILEEHLQQLKTYAANRIIKSKQSVSSVITPQFTPTSTTILASPPSLPSVSQNLTIDPMRSESDSATASIYIIDSSSSGGNISNLPTIDRYQKHHLPWVNINRYIIDSNNDESMLNDVIVPSGQPMCNYISTIRTSTDQTMKAERGVYEDQEANGFSSNISGRTTITSGCVSSSGITALSGSNNTLNDSPAEYMNHAFEVTEEDTISRKDVESSILEAVIKNHCNSNGNTIMTNGSTVKLIPSADDETNSQSKCSIFRGLLLCVCLNITHGNIVRFPRELDKYGLAYLVPYIILLFLVGLPTVILEISIGQFLGQGAAHTWRASPIFKGACIISRFASWMSTIWISLHVVLAMSYIGMFFYRTVPFKECVGNLRISLEGYTVTKNSGQECIQKTFLTPFWENAVFFCILSTVLIILWLFIMIATHKSRFVRRLLFIGGLIGFTLLCLVTGWEVNNSLNQLQPYFPELWSFSSIYLSDSNVWFSALMQIIFSLNCGFGVLPTLTGKFLYKGDAVRTAVVYVFINLLVNALTVTLFMVQFDHSANSGDMIDELKPLTAIYDRVLYNKTQHNSNHEVWKQAVLPILIYVLISISGILSIIMAIYTSSRLVPRHRNYVICLVALVASIISLTAPKFYIARLLDSRIVGTIVIIALVFKLIALTWIYGAKNIYTDLEFSIGHPIFKGWMSLWCICPPILTALLVWWCSDDDQYDILADLMPRWAPILIALSIILFIACVQIFRQVEYNFFGMICEASKSAKEWGPADPLARHAWKQWRSVCQDTGHRDFTLRRRGTKDYTHSIKKGQYSSASQHKHVNDNNDRCNGRLHKQQKQTQKLSTQTEQQQHQQHQQTQQWNSGNSSPNYSESVFGDSAIEEDISVDKFPNITQQPKDHQQTPHVPFCNTLQSRNSSNNNDIKQTKYSHRTQKQEQQAQQYDQLSHSANKFSQHAQQHRHNHIELISNQPQPYSTSTPYHNHQHNLQQHREIVYIRRFSKDEGDEEGEQAHTTRIKITPSNESITYKSMRSPLAHCKSDYQQQNKNLDYIKRTRSSDEIDHHHHYSRQNQRNSIGTTINRSDNCNRNDNSKANIIQLYPRHDTGNEQNICWRKYAINPEEYSTEL